MKDEKCGLSVDTFVVHLHFDFSSILLKKKIFFFHIGHRYKWQSTNFQRTCIFIWYSGKCRTRIPSRSHICSRFWFGIEFYDLLYSDIRLGEWRIFIESTNWCIYADSTTRLWRGKWILTSNIGQNIQIINSFRFNITYSSYKLKTMVIQVCRQLLPYTAMS